MIQFTYDEEAKAIYVVLSDKPACSSTQIATGIQLDFDEDGNRVGVEILL